MRLMTAVLFSSLLVACSTHNAQKSVAKDKLIRGSVITFEKRMTLENPFKTLPYHKGTKTKVKSINLAIVKKSEIAPPAQAGRSIASTCEYVKFCKLNVPNLKPKEHAEIAGSYTVLADGIMTNNHIKSWTLVNGDGEEIKLTCGVQSKTTDMNCKQKLSKLQIKDMGSFIEKLMDVKVAAAK